MFRSLLRLVFIQSFSVTGLLGYYRREGPIYPWMIGKDGPYDFEPPRMYDYKGWNNGRGYNESPPQGWNNGRGYNESPPQGWNDGRGYNESPPQGWNNGRGYYESPPQRYGYDLWNNRGPPEYYYGPRGPIPPPSLLWPWLWGGYLGGRGFPPLPGRFEGQPPKDNKPKTTTTSKLTRNTPPSNKVMTAEKPFHNTNVTRETHDNVAGSSSSQHPEHTPESQKITITDSHIKATENPHANSTESFASTSNPKITTDVNITESPNANATGSIHLLDV